MLPMRDGHQPGGLHPGSHHDGRDVDARALPGAAGGASVPAHPASSPHAGDAAWVPSGGPDHTLIKLMGGAIAIYLFL